MGFFMLVAGIVGFSIAESKGKSDATWGLICFIFPIALLFLLMSRYEKKVTGDVKYYEYDAPLQVVKSENEKSLNEVKSNIQIPTHKNCPKCDEEIKIRAIVCKHCGYEYSEQEININLDTIASLEEEIVKDEAAKEELEAQNKKKI